MEKRVDLRYAHITDEKLKKWHIAYTYPKAERKIHSKLQLMGVTSFLPLHKVVRDWSDRKKRLEVPLFPNYIFIHTSKVERFQVLKIKEIIRYISFDGKPATVSDILIDSLKKVISGDLEVMNEKFVEGMPIQIIAGPFIGAEGILIRRNGASRLVVQIEALQSAVSVDISASSVVPVISQ